MAMARNQSGVQKSSRHVRPYSQASSEYYNTELVIAIENIGYETAATRNFFASAFTDIEDPEPQPLQLMLTNVEPGQMKFILNLYTY